MAIRPVGSTGSVISAGGNTLYVESSDRQYDVIRFQREEYKHKRLLEAPNEDTTTPQILTMIAGRKIQIGFGCGQSDTVRKLTPDDDDLNLIYRRFNVTRYILGGLTSNPTAVENMFTTAATHRLLWEQFQARQLKVASGDISYQELVTVYQAQNFTYLTTTGFNVTGQVCSVSDALVRDFTLTYDIVRPNGVGGFVKWLGWKAVIEKLVEVADT